MPYLPEVPQHHGDATRIVERGFGFGLTDNCIYSGRSLAARRVERPWFRLVNVRDMIAKNAFGGGTSRNRTRSDLHYRPLCVGFDVIRRFVRGETILEQLAE